MTIYELSTTDRFGFVTSRIVTGEELRNIPIRPNQKLIDITPYLKTK